MAGAGAEVSGVVLAHIRDLRTGCVFSVLSFYICSSHILQLSDCFLIVLFSQLFLLEKLRRYFIRTTFDYE